MLGPHLEQGHLVIRAYFPTAERVLVTRDGAEPLEMVRRDTRGVFEAEVPGVDRLIPYPCASPSLAATSSTSRIRIASAA